MLGLNGFLPLVYESEVILKNVRLTEFCYDLKCPRHWFPNYGFLQMQFWWIPTTAWLGVLLFTKTCSVRTRTALRMQPLIDLLLECSFHICLMQLPKAHRCLEQVS